MERRVRVIYNPAANQGRAATLLPQLEQCLRLSGPADIAPTSEPGEATTLAAWSLMQGYDVVAAAGGDGTVNEVINGLMMAADHRSSPQAALGVIPIGSGNDFAWGAGVARDMQTACTRLFMGERRPIDVGYLSGGDHRSRYFGNAVGIGFDATVACELHKIRFVGGFLKYLAGVLYTLALHYKTPPVTIWFDGKEIHREILMVVVANGQRLGGGFLVTPEASMDDGYLDLCIGSQMGRLAILGMIPRLLRGTHIGDRRVQMERGQHIVVDVPDQLAVHLDGEIFSESARWLEIRVLPRWLWMVV